MPKFAANVTMLFTELPFLDRFKAAASAGFKAVEFLFPYEFEVAQLQDKIEAARLQVVLHNLPAGDWAGGDRGIATDPARVGEFQDGVARAITYAKALSCQQMNCLAGIPPAGIDDATARRTVVENIRFAARALEAAGLRLVVEPVNTRDVPGFYINKTAQALSILDDVAVLSAKLQYDIYHAQVMEGNLVQTIEANLSRIGHMQLADNPGRHEPGTGEINYPFVLSQIDALGYGGWIGCEYKPSAAGLGWLQSHGVHS